MNKSKLYLPSKLIIKYNDNSNNNNIIRNNMNAKQLIEYETNNAEKYNNYLNNSSFDRTPTGRLPTIADPWNVHNHKVSKYLEEENERKKKEMKKKKENNNDEAFKKWYSSKKSAGCFKKEYKSEQRSDPKKEQEKLVAFNKWVEDKDRERQEEKERKINEQKKHEIEMKKVADERRERIESLKKKRSQSQPKLSTKKNNKERAKKDITKIQKILVSPYLPDDLRVSRSQCTLRYVKEITSTELTENEIESYLEDDEKPLIHTKKE